MILEPIPVHDDGALPGTVLTEVTELYASNREFFAFSGDFPDPEHITEEQVAAALADELARPTAEVLLARSEGRLVGLAITLGQHPNPEDPDPWIGLLLVDAKLHRTGVGRQLADLVEDRFRTAGREAVRLAILEGNDQAGWFWTNRDYELIGYAEDLEQKRPCVLMRKELNTPAA
ncbi:GNAT family N-acetyltransferase [Streptomyces cavernicola]|uniref:GNAT family N-acetyltransferase n=1 Tax=Streptomyces cavernicola TaxID=3043613 RepID=A0ABT6SNU1_9ACTN|nr:GNAT family N-acetyltransferase [Streptomyces sp. B-S-A6]MDI3409103.1 GNAT family N-acetyltransferase [Streptomyces sp. B-S-A6]